jgi:Class II flagellar assembly regulator
MGVIDGLGRPGSPRPARRDSGTGQGRFSVSFGAAVTPATARGVAPASATRLEGMLALQEGEPETVEDRAARRRGHDLLAALAKLQAGILAGQSEPKLLQSLAALASDLPVATAPALRDALGAIAVRARVELARRRG